MIASASSISLDRMVTSVEKVRQRLLKAARALAEASVPYAVVGGNAVAAWVSTVDEGAVRNTRDVDLLLDRGSFEMAKASLEDAGFVFRHVAGIDLFLDGPDASARDAVHIVYAGEFVREGEPTANPPLSSAVASADFMVISLEALVQIKLTANRDKDRTHVRDLIEVGLVDASWLPRLSAPLAERLKGILDDPFG